MKQRCKNREEKNLLPFHIIKAASESDVMAINTSCFRASVSNRI